MDQRWYCNNAVLVPLSFYVFDSGDTIRKRSLRAPASTGMA